MKRVSRRLAAFLLGPVATATTLVCGVGLITLPVLRAQSVQNFKVDPDPVTYNGTSYNLGARAEKVIDFFTSTSTPSVVLAMNGSQGSIWLYQSSGGLNGFGKNPTAISHTVGPYYERAKSIRLPGRPWPDLVVSAPGSNGSNAGATVLFLNPLNPGGNGNPGEVWQQIYINPRIGCHDIKLADINGDGLVDVVCTGGAYLPGSQPFIAYQTSSLSTWKVVTSNVTQIDVGDGVAVWHHNGINNLIGCSGSKTYIYENPLNFGGDPMTQTWPSYPIGPGLNGNALGNLPNNMGVIVADSEEGTTSSIWTYGMIQLAPPASNPFSSAWTLVEIDDTVRTAHEIIGGLLPWNSQVFASFAEQEQRSAHCNSNGYYSAPDIGACRVGYYTYSKGAWSKEPVVFSTLGTQNQTLVNDHGALLVAGANFGNAGAYDKSLQIWQVTGGSGGGGNSIHFTVADTQGFVWDAGNAKFGGTFLQLYPAYKVPSQDFTWTVVNGGYSACSIGVCLSDNGSQIVLSSKADVLDVQKSGAILDVTTGRYLQNPSSPATGSIITTGSTQSIWRFTAP